MPILYTNVYHAIRVAFQYSAIAWELPNAYSRLHNSVNTPILFPDVTWHSYAVLLPVLKHTVRPKGYRPENSETPWGGGGSSRALKRVTLSKLNMPNIINFWLISTNFNIIFCPQPVIQLNLWWIASLSTNSLQVGLLTLILIMVSLQLTLFYCIFSLSTCAPSVHPWTLLLSWAWWQSKCKCLLIADRHLILIGLSWQHLTNLWSAILHYLQY